MTATVDDIDAVLRATPVFQKLSSEDRRKVAEVAAVRRYSKGQIIFEQGTPSGSCFPPECSRARLHSAGIR
jgi:hypothetical protein